MAKILSPEDSCDPYAFEELKDEALLVSRSMHTSLPCVEAVGSADGRFYVVHHMVEGGSFGGLLRSSGRPPVRAGVRVLLDLLEAYGAAVKAADVPDERIALSHLGVNPGDIRVGVDGRAKLSTVGVRSAGRIDPRTSSRWVSAIPWAAPEHFVSSGAIDQRSDVYSLAALVLFTVDALNSKRSVEVQVMGERPSPLWGDISLQFPNVAKVCARALALERQLRHATVKELEDELRTAAVMDGVLGTHREVADCVRGIFRDDLQTFRRALRDAAITFFSSDRSAERGSAFSWELRLKRARRNVDDTL